MSRLYPLMLLGPNTTQTNRIMTQRFIIFTVFNITMLAVGSLYAQSDCDSDGYGNPLHTTGTGEGHNTAAGDLAWDLLLGITCQGLSTATQQPIAAQNLKDYDPAELCNNSSDLIPEVSRNTTKVALIDSGVRPTSPGRFNESNLFSYQVSPAGVVTSGVSHPHPHGTYSAGVIIGMVDVYAHPNDYSLTSSVELYDYQVLNGDLRTSLAAVVAAINHAVINKVDLIALSIGFVPVECDGIDWESSSSPLSAAISYAESEGVIIVTSAGNNTRNLEESPQYPAVYPNHNLVSVGALSCEGNLPSSFSNYSRNIVDVFTTGDFVQVHYNGCFHSITGTSFATSIVAGKAALHLTKNRNPDKVLCLLRSQTKPFEDEQFSIYGIVEVPRISELNICANGETYDPNGGIPIDEGGSGTELPGNFGGGEKSAASSEGSTTPEVFKVTASPNPFYDQLRLAIENGKGASTIMLIDGQGRQVLNRQVSKSSVRLDLGHLPAGIYRVLIQNEAGSQTRTIVKK